MSTLRLYFHGPGVGESIVIKLPCGRWGLVDCYQPSPRVDTGVLGFLGRHRVEKLAFFCLTHPHVDHFLGTAIVLNHFEGNVDHFWKYPGFSGRGVIQRVLFAAAIKARRFRDPECAEFMHEYGRVLQAFAALKKSLPNASYRQIVGPVDVLEDSDYSICALGPSSDALAALEKRIMKYDFKNGRMTLSDEEGGDLNALSVRLRIEFGQALVLLLGDSQGAKEVISAAGKTVSVLKAAHHGSATGFGAELMADACNEVFTSCVITPYLRGGLPDRSTRDRYRETSRLFKLLGESAQECPAIQGVDNRRLVCHDEAWFGLEVSDTGEVAICPCE